MVNDWRSLPKIELHCHLDGSLGIELTQRLLRARGESYSLEELRSMLEAPADCMDLSDYLRRFDLPNQVLQTRAISSFAHYPFREFFDAGIPVSVNTDNRTVSATDLTGEYTRLMERFLLDEEERKRLYRDSVEVAFASDEVKERLLRQL